MERRPRTPPEQTAAPRSDRACPGGIPPPPDRAALRAADEASADDARRRLRERGIVPIEPDERIGVMLEPGELVVTTRRAALLDRRQSRPIDAPGLGGDLYVTTRRLVHLGRRPVVYDLDEIDEAIVVGDRLVLVVDDGLGVAIAVDDPRVLRVEIAAARAASADERSRPVQVEADDPQPSPR